MLKSRELHPKNCQIDSKAIIDENNAPPIIKSPVAEQVNEPYSISTWGRISKENNKNY